MDIYCCRRPVSHVVFTGQMFNNSSQLTGHEMYCRHADGFDSCNAPGRKS